MTEGNTVNELKAGMPQVSQKYMYFAGVGLPTPDLENLGLRLWP